MNLTELDYVAIVNALRVAAGVYNDDAAQMRKAGQLELARRFDDQRDFARKLRECIEAEEGV